MEAIYEVALAEYKNKSDDVMIKLDRYRTTLEPHIYHYLIEHHMSMLNRHWSTYQPPKKARRAFVIVERRAHPNFEFVLKNAAWACPTLSVYIFCSDVNRGFISALLGDKEPNYNIIVAFKGHGTREQGKTEYNNLLTDAKTYRQIDAEYIMTVQMDVIFRRKLPEAIFVGDFWGNPWLWKQEESGGGGATVRNVKKMIALCEQFRPDTAVHIKECEDAWISEHLALIGTTYPCLADRAQIIMESMPVKDPYILHQFWTFAETYLIGMTKNAHIEYWTHLLSIEF